MFTMSIKREIRRLASFSRVVTAKKCTKRRDASAKLLFCSPKRYALAALRFALDGQSQRGGAENNASKYVTRPRAISTRPSDQNRRKKANLVLFNHAWKPLVSFDSRKSYLILKLKAGRILHFFSYLG